MQAYWQCLVGPKEITLSKSAIAFQTFKIQIYHVAIVRPFIWNFEHTINNCVAPSQMTREGHLDRVRSKSFKPLDRGILPWESGCICTATNSRIFSSGQEDLYRHCVCMDCSGREDLYLCIRMALRISFSPCRITPATLQATCSTVLSTEILLCVEAELRKWSDVQTFPCHCHHDSPAPLPHVRRREFHIL